MFDTNGQPNHRPENVLRTLLALLLIAAMLLTPFPHTAQAAPPEQIDIVPVCDIPSAFSNPACLAYRHYDYGVLKDEVVDNLITTFELVSTGPIFEPNNNINRLLQYESGLVNAALFDRIMAAAKKDPAQRTAFENTVVAELATRIRNRRMMAAYYSKNQYEGWAANPCIGGWQPPQPFPRYAPTTGCTLIGGLFTRPKPPSFETFQQYGAAYVYGNLNNDAALQVATADATKGYIGAAAFSAVGITMVAGGIVGAVIGGSAAASALVGAIFPFAVIAGTTAAVGAAAFAGPAAIAILAIVTIVFQGISVVADAELPVKLDQGIARAQQPVDLQAMIQPGASEAGKQEIFATFIESTMPATPITLQAPTGLGGFFRSTQANSSGQNVQEISLKDWDGNPQTVKVFDNWFVITNSASASRYSLDLEVLNADNVRQTVWRKGATQFVMANANQTNATGLLSTSFSAQHSNGSDTIIGFPTPDAQSFTPGPLIITVARSSGAYSAPWATNIVQAPGGVYFDVTWNEPTGSLIISDNHLCLPPDIIGISGQILDYLTISNDGTLRFATRNDYCGSTALYYITLRDKDGIALSPTYYLKVVVNSPPVANDDSFTSNKDTPLIGNVLTNDTDVEHAALNSALITQPAHGSVQLAVNGFFTYTPAPGYSGYDSFTYRTGDWIHVSNRIATVNIRVNAAPVANNDSYTISEDTVLTGDVLTNDTDDNPVNLSDPVPSLRVIDSMLLSQPAHGTVALNVNGTFIYTPIANYNGSDSFTYQGDDGLLASNIATVNITVTPVNDAPVAVNDSYSVAEDTVLSGNLLTNDTDADAGATLNLGTPSPATHGTITYNNLTGAFTYTPDANYSGPDSFTYIIGDSIIVSNRATVSINVTAVNDAPVANNDSYSTNEDTALTGNVLTNDTDIETAALSSALIGQPAHGTITFNDHGNGSFTYTPAANYSGPDSFTYHAGDGSLLSNSATVNITITEVNDAPGFTTDIYADIYVTTGAGPQSFPNWASNITAGEAGQTVSFAVTTDRPDLFSVQPTINSAGTLSFTASTCGVTAHAQITATDTGVPAASSAVRNIDISINCSTTATLALSANPVAFGAPVTMTLKVTKANGETITQGYSIVTVDDFGLYTDFSEFEGGYVLSDHFQLPVGEHLIEVDTFPSGFSTQSSASSILHVEKATTTTSFTTSNNPALVGEAITFRATVTNPYLTPDGTVSFLSGTTVLGTGTLVNGVATFTTSSLPVGNSVITVRYESDTNFKGSSSAPSTQMVLSTSTATPISTATSPATATSTPTTTPLATSTPSVTSTPSNTATASNTATSLATATSTASSTPLVTSTPTSTATPISTATNTPVAATSTRTSTPVAATSTRTSTPVAATSTRTNTPVAATSTRTSTPVAATSTRTSTPVAATSTTVPPGSFPQRGVLNPFTQANGSVGSMWDGLNTTSFYKIVSNQLDVQIGGPLIWKATAFGTNQEAFVTLSTIDPKSPSQGVLLKVQTGENTDGGAISVVYDAVAKAVRVSTLRLNKPTWTFYDNQAATFANGDQLGARTLANGTVRIYKNGALIAIVTLNAQDQAFFNTKGGKIGIWTVAAPNAVLDSFGGGSVTP